MTKGRDSRRREGDTRDQRVKKYGRRRSNSRRKGKAGLGAEKDEEQEEVCVKGSGPQTYGHSKVAERGRQSAG